MKKQEINRHMLEFLHAEREKIESMASRIDPDYGAITKFIDRKIRRLYLECFKIEYKQVKAQIKNLQNKSIPDSGNNGDDDI